jgi:3-deoxy-D-arabino-heptulosonate 7-phosphate (DAHP) synthase
VADTLVLVMSVDFEKPRTALGWRETKEILIEMAVRLSPKKGYGGNADGIIMRF